MSEQPFNYSSCSDHQFQSDYWRDQILDISIFIENNNHSYINDSLQDRKQNQECLQKQLSAREQAEIHSFSAQNERVFTGNQDNYSQNNGNNVHSSGQSEDEVQIQDGSNQYNKAENLEQTQREGQESYLSDSSFKLSYKTNKSIRKYTKKTSKNTAPSNATRNMLQFFWKVFRNYINSKSRLPPRSKFQSDKSNSVWKQMDVLNPSLPSFTKLFKNGSMRAQLIAIFKSKYLMREIMRSNLKQTLKVVYVRYVKVLLRGFIFQKLDYLN